MHRGDISLDFLPTVSSFMFSKMEIIEVSNPSDLTSVMKLGEIPPLSTCLDVRSKLSKRMLDVRGNRIDSDGDSDEDDRKREGILAVHIEGLGKFDLPRVQELVRLNNARTVAIEVREERQFFKKISEISGSQFNIPLAPLEEFFNEIWHNEENGCIFGGLRVADAKLLCCDRWLSDDLIEHFFNKFNDASDSHLFFVFSEVMQIDPDMFRSLFLQRYKPGVKFIHFAVNIKKSTISRKTSIANGNHWVYVVISSDGLQLFYGDPKGWSIPENVRACFDPLLQLLKKNHGNLSKDLEVTAMHVPSLPTAQHHICNNDCSPNFPIQTCQSLCGAIVILVSACAVLETDIWESMILHNCSAPTSLSESPALLKFLRHPSTQSVKVRSLLMSWLGPQNITGIGFAAFKNEVQRSQQPACTSVYELSKQENNEHLARDNNHQYKKRKPFDSGGQSDNIKKVKKTSPSCNLPFPELSKQFYGRQHNPGGENINKTTDFRNLPFPKLSKQFYGRQHNPGGENITKKTVESSDLLFSDKLEPSTFDDSETFPVHTQESLIPKSNTCILSGLSKRWFRRRGMLSLKNISRSKSPSMLSESIEESIRDLEKKKQTATAKKYNEISRMVSVGKCIMEYGPLIPTQEIGQIIYQNKCDVGKQRRQRSSEILRKIQRHFKVIQVYLRGTAYIMENRGQNVIEIAKRLEAIAGSHMQEDINAQIQSKVGPLLKNALKFMDTKDDRDLVKGLFAKATSVKFVAKMMGVQNKSAIRSAMDEVEHKVTEYLNIECTSLVVRNDMTNEQQRRLTKRIIAQRKQKKFRLENETRGRKLKAEIFPELKFVLEEIFSQGSGNMVGGLESHPRLTTDIMYRSRDNNLYKRQAREILLKFAPPGFGISLKSCYNYTDSYKENTYSAKRHHAGKDVNARISLKCPPRIGVSKQVVNLHWSTKNVNLCLESTENCESDCIIDSKDAKTIICGDIQPVQNPGKSWKPITYEDHTFDQSRTNAVYPMAHLFLDNSGNTRKVSKEDSSVVEVTRTGRSVILINIALTETETTFRAMNEFFYLLTIPSLDNIFRNPSTGSLKSVISFIVDNGHGEDPDSLLTQMCLARILLLLRLKKISQRSFAEYHSKRNFVERVHASENEALSRHGAFSSKQIHPHAESGSKEHLENMEKMALDVKDCLSNARFAGRFLECFRGIKDRGIFNDEEKLKTFINFSEERKQECEWTYCPETLNADFQALVQTWGVPIDFERSYVEDYDLIMNNHGKRTAWKDKYSTTLYGDSNPVNSELQPIPDFVRWINTGGELHYLSYEKTSLLGLIDTPQLFLPSILLDTFFIIDNDPPDDVLSRIAILSWIPVKEVETYFNNKRLREEKEYQHDISRETWRRHILYKKSLADLQQLCKSKGLSSKGLKYQLVQRIAQQSGEENDMTSFEPTFSGLDSLPNSLVDLKKMPVPSIKYILKCNDLSTCGKKDDLILRLYLLRHGRAYLACHQEEKAMLECIEHATKIIAKQVSSHLLEYDDITRIRAHRNHLKEKATVKIPDDITVISDLHQLFSPLKRFLTRRRTKKVTTSDPGIDNFCDEQISVLDEFEQFFEIGCRVKVRWSKEEIGDSGWRPGWYTAEVQHSSPQLDQITVVYLSEPEAIYNIDVTTMLATGKLRLS